mgnify:CR=1 FL=1
MHTRKFIAFYCPTCHILNVSKYLKPMNLNLPKYSKLIKILSIIPVAVGLMTFIEVFLPYKSINTVITSKNTSYRARFHSTTYSIDFTDNNDQFTEEIYNSFHVNDEVIVYATYFNEEVAKIKNKNSGKIYENSTGEVYFLYGFALLYLLAGLTWIKKHNLSAEQCKFALFIIIFSSITFFRILI